VSNRFHNGQDIRLDIAMRASRHGGIEHYNQTCGTPREYEDPLDSFDPNTLNYARKSLRRQKDHYIMNGDDVRNVRARLGTLWGLDRPLTQAEFGRILRLGGVRPDHSVRDYESGKTQVSGPLSLLIELLLAGARPAGLDDTIAKLK
jgi:hypothetical protein